MNSLYAPFKAIGYVCDSNPFVINRLGEEIFLTVTIGQCFQVFRFNKLVSCLVSKSVSANITCMQVSGQETFAAVGNDIVVYNRTNIVRTYDAHEERILGLLTIGQNLISYDVANNIKVIDMKLRKVVVELSVMQKSRIACIVHPSTYVNKVLVGYENGELELWNISKRVLVYTFQSHKVYFSKSPASATASVSCLEQSPACDVIAVGFSDGNILLINLKLDLVLFTFKQDGGAVTSLSFRTDALAERYPFMVSATAEGRLHIWNLGTGDTESVEMTAHAERKLQSSIEDAHEGSVSRVAFLHGEPIMISAGAADNSIKVWIFDSPDGNARLLRSREGHSGGPTRIRYYGGSTNVSMRDNADATSCELISAGSDGTLRLFNTAIESQNRELSQKPMLKILGLQRRNERLPECVGFDFSETRQRDWGNMASIHRNHCDVYVWKFRHRVITPMVLRQPSWSSNQRKFATDRRNHATGICISPCGNFCVVGYKGGAVYKYNIQSGKSRGAFPRSDKPDMKAGLVEQRARVPGNVLYEERRMAEDAMLTPSAVSAPSTASIELSSAHNQEVTGLFVDMTNATLVSCGLDGRVSFWDFSGHHLLHQALLDSPQLMLQGFRDGNFVAVAGQDRVVRLYDMHTFKLSRRFAGHAQEITDLAFTPDGRRLLSSSGDSTVRVWDIPTGRCLSWMRFSSPVLSMAVSLSGEYLCVAQADKEGVFMYVDRSLYETVHFWREPVVPSPVADSCITVDEQHHADAAEARGTAFFTESPDLDLMAAVTNIDQEMGSITPSQAQVITGIPTESENQRGGGTITLSAVPRAYWTSLFHLETIKKRSKPKAPPAAAPLAPFFLPTIVRGGSTPSFPTPAEYAEIAKNIAVPEVQPQNVFDSSANVFTSGGVLTKREHEAGTVTADMLSTKRPRVVADTVVDSAVQDESAVMAELALMGSVWEDSAEDSAEDSTSTGIATSWSLDRTGDSQDKSANLIMGAITTASSEQTKETRSQSRLISKRTTLPRCKLMAYLLEKQSHAQATSPVDEQLLEYLKRLAPPAVDLEIRALCSHESDEEGIALLHIWLTWLESAIRSGHHFEILQAYLHRTFMIYAELSLKLPQLSDDLKALVCVTASSADRFREALQKNLCLMKMMANIPVT